MSQEEEMFDPRKKVRRKWRRRNRLKILGKIIIFCFIVGGLAYFVKIAHSYLLPQESLDIPIRGEEPQATNFEPFKLQSIAYGEKLELEPGITASLQRISVTKNGARFDVMAIFFIENLTDSDFRVDPAKVELIDARGYTYLKEADKQDQRQTGRLMAPARRQTEVEIAFFVEHHTIYNQFSIVFGGKRVLVKNEGDPVTKFILGETVSFSTSQW